MHLIERPLFTSDLLTIRHAVARPSEAELSELAWAGADLLLLPVDGVFALHDAPKQHFIANANHGLFLALGQPYRMSFPGRIGDECLVLHFSAPALSGMLAEAAGADTLRSPRLRPHCLLPPPAMLERSMLQRALMRDERDALEIEELCVTLMDASLRTASRCAATPGTRTPTRERRRRQVEAVKEAISLRPAQEWTLDALARHAHTTPYHLARIFREEVGIPVHRYLVRTRLARALSAIESTGGGLTAIALDTGFTSHSHLTASFRAHFGTTPAALRRRLEVR
ncbi:helix-turn-helix transcriptional regulator [Noviherbaspirillum sp.]|uniref:helix-turn-helix transcriptional regulator n=1 Tax=Noviherbaspirillum sp. TaxID=1926288 RepID=UPI002D46BC72|nr:helix-turn-helix transcriptional regulator [Noviherbaspirillum sp.]HZW23657.1 helix-turn-helix transcriptional regulator [Noviherbaspirillum sp.]